MKKPVLNYQILKDYVLKSTIPPVQKCPACVCPKVKVSAGMCKECPPQKIIVPSVLHVGLNNVKMLLSVPHMNSKYHALNAHHQCHALNHQKSMSAFEMPESNIKCPSPKPCPLPNHVLINKEDVLNNQNLSVNIMA